MKQAPASRTPARLGPLALKRTFEGWTRSALIAVILAMLLVGGCGRVSERDGGNGPAKPRGLETTYDVRLKGGARLLSVGTLEDQLVRTEADGATFVFSSGESLAGLQSGDVVVLAGRAVRRVAGITRQGSQVHLATVSATLADAFQEGQIGWDLKPDFTTEGELAFKGELEGWDITLGLIPVSPRRLEITLEARQPAAEVSARGYVESFTSKGTLRFADGTVESLVFESLGVMGEIQVEWAATASQEQSVTGSARLEFPVEIPIDFLVGDVVPVALRITAAARITPDVRLEGASSRGAFKVGFGADEGFSFAAGKATPVGSISRHEPAITGTVNSTGTLTTGLGFGIEFPRVELRVFGESVVPFVSIDTYSYSLFKPATGPGRDPCHVGALVSKGVAAYNLSTLGFADAPDGELEIWRKEFKRYGGGTPCD